MTDNQDRNISTRLKQIRGFLNLKQKPFAEKANIKQSQVSEIENGKRNITPAILIALENAFDINRDWLMTGHGPMFLDVTIVDGQKRVTAYRDSIDMSTEEGLKEFREFASKNSSITDQDIIKDMKRHIENLERQITMLQENNEYKNAIIKELKEKLARHEADSSKRKVG